MRNIGQIRGNIVWKIVYTIYSAELELYIHWAASDWVDEEEEQKAFSEKERDGRSYEIVVAQLDITAETNSILI